jgi:hypothetical protein
MKSRVDEPLPEGVVRANEIVEGKSYVTSSGQVRFVHKIEDGKVIYSMRGKKFTKDWEKSAARPPNPPSVETFANDVEHEVPYIYDPDFGN